MSGHRLRAQPSPGAPIEPSRARTSAPRRPCQEPEDMVLAGAAARRASGSSVPAFRVLPELTKFHGRSRLLRDRPVTPSSLRTNVHVRPGIWRHPHLLDRGRLCEVSAKPGIHRPHSPAGHLSYRHVLLRSIVLPATIDQRRTGRRPAPMSVARPCGARVEWRTQLRLLQPGRLFLHNPLQFGRDRHAARLYDRRNKRIAAF